MRQLSWTAFLQLLPLKDPVSRDFYGRMAATHGWSVRELRRHIDTKTFERTALASTQGSEAVNLSIPASEFVVFSLGPKTA